MLWYYSLCPSLKFLTYLLVFKARIGPPVDAVDASTMTVFGEAVAFYSIHYPDKAVQPETLVVYVPLISERQTLGQIRGTWSTNIACINIKHIVDIVGIWEGIVTNKVYMIRKHPALALLNAIELGNDLSEGSMNEDDEGAAREHVSIQQNSTDMLFFKAN